MNYSLKTIAVVSALISSCNLILAQSVGISNSVVTPDPQSILDIQSTTKGVLFPRMTTGERTTFAPSTGSDKGMMVYDTDTESYWYWDGTTNVWREIPNTAGLITTLDGAYDGGGFGLGLNITADAGPITIIGTGGNRAIDTDGDIRLAEDQWIGLGSTIERIGFDGSLDRIDVEAADVTVDDGKWIGIDASSPRVTYTDGAPGILDVDDANLRLDDDTWLGLGSSIERFVFQGTDNEVNLMGAEMGIGTLAPTQALDVNGQIRMRTGAMSGYVPVSTTDGTMTWTDPTTITTAGFNLDQAYDKGGAGVGRTITADAGAVNIAGADGLTVNGNVGIGSTSLSNKLTIDGTAPIAEIRSGGYLMLRRADNGWDMRLNQVSTRLDVLSGGSLSTPIASFLHGGTVGIGTTAPQHQLNVGATTADGQLVTIRGYSNTPGSWKGGAAFGYSSATVIMGELYGVANIGGHSATLGAWADLSLNLGGGNVGVGIDVPLEKLDVVGSIRLGSGAGKLTLTNDNVNGSIVNSVGNSLYYTPVSTSFIWHVNGASQMALSAAGNLGVGTVSPAGKAHFVTADSDGNVGSWNSGQLVVGQAAASGVSSGAVGISYSTTNNTGYISSLSPTTSWRDLVIRSRDFYVNSVGGTERFRIESGGNYRLALQSDNNMVYYTSANCPVWATGTSCSDIRKKDRIVPLESMLPTIQQLSTIRFHYKEELGLDKDEHIGVVAQEIEKHFPDMVYYDETQDSYLVYYDKLTTVLIKGMQEQQEMIEALKADNQTMKSQLSGYASLVSEIDAIKAAIGIDSQTSK